MNLSHNKALYKRHVYLLISMYVHGSSFRNPIRPDPTNLKSTQSIMFFLNCNPTHDLSLSFSISCVTVFVQLLLASN